MQTAYDDFICLFFIFFKGQMESLIKNNHYGLYPPEHVSRAGKINPDYFLCRFHVINKLLLHHKHIQGQHHFCKLIYFEYDDFL